MTITSKPTVTYFALDGNQGLGGEIYLLLSDAGVEYEKRTFAREEWPALKEQLISSGKSPHGIVPLLELDGKAYAHRLPILRLLSRRLGKYGGANDEEQYEVDAFSDLIADFRSAWAVKYFGDQKAIETYESEKRDRFLKSVDRYLAKTSGPYILGNEPSYADFSLLSFLLDSKHEIDAYPHIKTFSDAIKARPGVAKYLSK